MRQRNIAEISAKLVKVIQTRDASRVRQLADVLDRQTNANLTLAVFATINHTLETTDRNLQRWFQDIYFEGCPADVKALWLDFITLPLPSNNNQNVS